MDAYSPLPVHGLAEAIGFEKTRVPLVVLIGGMSGCIFGYALCYYMSAVAYVHNVAGRPPYSWPAYIPITFECTVLFAAISAVVGLIVLNKLPTPYHPVFNVDRFARASKDRFFLCIEAKDPKYDIEGTRAFLASLPGSEVYEVDA